MTRPQPKLTAFETAAPRLGEADLVAAYRTMLRIRRFEEKAAQLYAMGDIAVLHPLSIGQEAILAAAAFAAGPERRIASLTPSTGLYLATGHCPGNLMESVVDGSFSKLDQNVAAADIIIADPSVAEAQRDTALEQLKSRAAVFVTINTTTDVSDALNLRADQSAFVKLAAGLGIPAEVADGTDAGQLCGVFEAALNLARQSQTPRAVEVMLHRYRGHARTGQPNAKPSLPRELIDPLARTRAAIAESDGLSEIEQAIRDEINAAAARARGI